MARKPQVPGGEPEQPQEAAAPEVAEEVSSLPRPEDVDPKKIRRAVLTTAGWICPETLPTPKE
jgi:hypothetical protein